MEKVPAASALPEPKMPATQCKAFGNQPVKFEPTCLADMPSQERPRVSNVGLDLDELKTKFLTKSADTADTSKTGKRSLQATKTLGGRREASKRERREDFMPHLSDSCSVGASRA